MIKDEKIGNKEKRYTKNTITWYTYIKSALNNINAKHLLMFSE